MFRRILTIELAEDGVSQLQLSADGDMDGNKFTFRGIGKVDGEFGQAVFSSSMISESLTHDFTSRAYFNSDGVVVGSDASPSFDVGGHLHIAATEVPGALPQNYSPSELPLDAWDCVGEEDLILNMAGEKGELHDSCNEEEDYVDDDYCKSESHEPSSEQIELEGDGKNIEELNEIAG